LGYNRKI